MKLGFITVIFLGIWMIASTRIYASDFIEFDPPSNAKEIKIVAEVPDNFKERIEIYFNGVPRSLSYDADLPNNGYTMQINIEPDVYKIKVISSTNIDKRYEFYTLGEFDAENNGLLNIKVVDTWESESVADYDEHADMVFEEIKIHPLEYDFAGDAPYGTIHIICKTYAAVESVVFRLVGGDSVFDVVLDRDHMFEAIVKLPIGSYYESSTISVDLDQDTRAIEGVDYLWAHKENLGFFGIYYEISEGSTSYINDLMIQMMYQGEIEEFNSNILFRPTLVDNYLNVRESHVSEELESAFPDGGYEEETETIATAEQIPEAEISFQLGYIFAMAAGIFCLILIVIIILIRRTRSNRYY